MIDHEDMHEIERAFSDLGYDATVVGTQEPSPYTDGIAIEIGSQTALIQIHLCKEDMAESRLDA